MHFKMSARELTMLQNRPAILRALRRNQHVQMNGHVGQRRPTPLPILIVAEDDSHLMAIITRFEDKNDDDAKDDAKDAKRQGESRGLWSNLLRRWHRPDGVHDRQIRRHRRRLEDGLALSVHGALLTAGIPCDVRGIDTAAANFFEQPLMLDLQKECNAKCHVRVLQSYTALFNVINALLQTDLTLKH